MNKKRIHPPCPYCAQPSLFRELKRRRQPKPHFMPFPAIGKYWEPATNNSKLKRVPFVVELDHYRIILQNSFLGSGKIFTDKYHPFKVEFIVLRLAAATTSDPGGNPFFIKHVRTSTPEGQLREEWLLYGGCRVTHAQSDIEIHAHWWPSHDTIMQVSGFKTNDLKNRDAKIMRDAMGFFEVEARGSARITEVRVKETVAELGPAATQVATAKSLEVTESALEKWRQRRGFDSWREAVESFSGVPQ